MLTSVHVPLFIDTYFVQSQSEEHKGKGALETVRGTMSSVPSRLKVPHMELTSWPPVRPAPAPAIQIYSEKSCFLNFDISTTTPSNLVKFCM
jgi:hypothetical protein